MNNVTLTVKSAAVRLIAVLGVVALLSGCNTREIEPVVPESSRLSVSAGDTPDFSNAPVLTKGQVYTEDGSFVFNDGEAISIWYDDNQYRSFPVKAGTVETGTQTAKRTNWSLYPLSAVPSSNQYNGTAPYVIYTDTYSVTRSETDSQMPLVAKNTDASGNPVNKLVFYHVGGLLRLKLYGVPDNVVSVKVEFAQSAITGTYAVDVSTPTAPVTTTGTGTGRSVTFNFTGTATGSAYELVPYVNIPLPAGEYPKQDLYVTLYDSSGNPVHKDGAPEFFTTEVNLGTVTRRDGRILGVSLYGITGAVLGVEITGESGFLNSGTLGMIGGLYLSDSPFESQLYATVTYNSRSVQDNSLVDWESEDPTKVLVVNGKVMAVDVTTDPVRIWARAKDDPSKEAYVFITVSKDSPSGNFVQKPFSISPTETVEFSPGNLVANTTGSEVTWRFASHQYDMIGANNGNTMTLDSLDTFYFSGAENDFGLYRAPSGPTGLCIFRDWGLNQIAYRGNPAYAAAGTYGTLTYEEMNYLFYVRTGDQAGSIGDRPDCRFAGVNVEGVYGLLLFPDRFQWVRSTMGDYPKRINTYAAPDNSAYSGAQWAALEEAGVVFLPATGRRSGTQITSAGTVGYYHAGGKDKEIRQAL